LNNDGWYGCSATEVLGSLLPGKYIIDVRDDDNCITTSGEIIIGADGTGAFATATSTPETACGEKDGTITLTFSNTGTYKYQIGSGGINTVTDSYVIIEGFSAGIYSWNVADIEGCYAQGEVTVGSDDLNKIEAEIIDKKDADCDGAGGGEFTVNVKNPTGTYTCYIGSISKPAPATFDNLTAGFYTVFIEEDGGDCTFEIQNIEIKKGGNTSAPSVATPQTFCFGATVANLKTIDGINIEWYATETGGTALPPGTTLVHGNIYYAGQDVSDCEGLRSPVKVILDNNVFIDAPYIPDVELCDPATLADVPTNGDPNIEWYATLTGGLPLPLSTPLTDGDVYFAAIKGGGSCTSIYRREVNFIIHPFTPEPPTVESPQHFCEGALLSNMNVPNDKIVWYAADNTPLPLNTKLVDGETYYAAQKAGSCEGGRTAVLVHLDGYPAPIAPSIQPICHGATVYLSDLIVTGAGIKWYTNGGVLITSPSTHQVNPNET
jgi:hypothetical protein